MRGVQRIAQEQEDANLALFSRRFSPTNASPRLRSQFHDRLTELGGFILLALALALSVALWSYNPQDPSFDTATKAVPTNILGQPGATLADAWCNGSASQVLYRSSSCYAGPGRSSVIMPSACPSCG